MSSDTLRLSEVFQCKKCGDCCNGYGGTFITAEDIEAISNYIKTDPRDFVTDYCQMSGGKPILGQGKNGYCLFWNGLCLIHPVKPRMCRKWPFIKAVLVDSDNWSEMASVCPGINKDIPISRLKEFLRKKCSKNRIFDLDFRPCEVQGP